MLLVTSWPSIFSWKLPAPPIGVSLDVFCRDPGASIVRSIQFRPFSGRSCIWRGSTLAPMVELTVSISGASPVTVTDSCTVEGDSWRLTTAV